MVVSIPRTAPRPFFPLISLTQLIILHILARSAFFTLQKRLQNGLQKRLHRLYRLYHLYRLQKQSCSCSLT